MAGRHACALCGSFDLFVVAARTGCRHTHSFFLATSNERRLTCEALSPLYEIAGNSLCAAVLEELFAAVLED